MIDYQELAKEAAGNWQSFDSFGWHDSPEDGEDWTILHTDTRDSTLLEQSNASAFKKALEPFSEDTVKAQRFNHWACGWIDGFAVKVHNPDRSLTDAFKVVCDLQAALESYPLLDESDYSAREYEASVENITSILGTLGQNADELPDWSNNESVASGVYRWLGEHEPSEAESCDDQGAYPSEASVFRALKALGYN